MIGISDSVSRRYALSRLAAVGLGAILASTQFAGNEVLAAPADAEYPPDIVLDWLGAWSDTGGPRKIADIYAPDGTHADIASQMTLQQPEIASYLQPMFDAVYGMQRYPRTAFAISNYAVVDQLFTAMAPNGYDKLFEVYALTLFEFDDSSMLYTADYYDSGTILKQLGAIADEPWFDALSLSDAAISLDAKSS